MLERVLRGKDISFSKITEFIKVNECSEEQVKEIKGEASELVDAFSQNSCKSKSNNAASSSNRE